MLNCDGNQIGRTWKERFAHTPEKRDEILQEFTKPMKYGNFEANFVPGTIGRSAEYDGDTSDQLTGWVCWMGTTFVYWKEVELE